MKVTLVKTGLKGLILESAKHKTNIVSMLPAAGGRGVLT